MLKLSMIVLLLAAIAVPSVLFATQGQQGTEARINAYKHEDGRVEFAMQVREGDGWGERILPRGRVLGTNARTGRWLNSTPVSLPTSGLLESLPIRTPWMTMRDNPSVTICAGQVDCTHDRRQVPLERATTLVSVEGTPLNEPIRHAYLLITCVAGGTVSDAHDSYWVEGGFEGWIRLWERSPDNPGKVRWLYYDFDRGVAVVARQYSLLDDQELVRENRFDLERLSFDYDWLEQLRWYTDLWVQVRDTKGNPLQVHFDIAGMLETPLQLNLENCGRY